MKSLYTVHLILTLGIGTTAEQTVEIDVPIPVSSTIPRTQEDICAAASRSAVYSTTAEGELSLLAICVPTPESNADTGGV